jgi:hypothetical protein
VAPNLWAGGFLLVTLAAVGQARAEAQKPGVDVGAVRAHVDSVQKAKSDSGAKVVAVPAPSTEKRMKGAAPKAAAKADSVKRANDAAPADSLRDPSESEVLRESFTYGGAPRDPFASLIKTARNGPELSDLQLVAIYEDLRYSGNSVAVLREKTGGKRHKLRAGDQLGRLRVTQVRAKDVVFTIQDFGYERQETLSLRKQEDVTP